MRIDSQLRPAYVVDIKGVTPASAPRGSAPAVAQQGGDKVKLSPQARELSRLKQDLAALPDVRLDRVALARQQMQYGPYRVDATALARKILNQE